MTALVCAALLASPQDLEPLLARGPVVAVATDEKGGFATAVGQVEVDAPLETVWAAVVSSARYKELVPKVVESAIKKRCEP